MDQAVLDKILSRIDSYQDDVIRLQKELTSLPGLAPENGGDGETQKAEFLHGYLKETIKCDEIEVQNAPDPRVTAGSRPNIVATLQGDNKGPAIVLMSHLDVVPAGDVASWTGDPWQARVEDGRIFGRGTEDNQQGIVSSLLAAKAFRDEGVSPKSSLRLVLVADEETGSKYGIQYLLQNKPKLFHNDDIIVIPDSGNSEGTAIEVAEKSILWLKIRVIGKMTHGSTPDKGINALTAAANLIVKLSNLYVIFSDEDPLFEPPKSTFEPTRIDRSVDNINTVPGEVTFYLDCRTLPGVDLGRVKTIVKNACSAVEQRYRLKVELSTEQEIKAAPATATDAVVVKALQKAISDLRQIEAKPMGIGGGTVAAFFRDAGFPVAVWATQEETLHAPNENAKIENIIADAKVFAHLALQDV